MGGLILDKTSVYLKWNTKKISDHSDTTDITSLYNEGFVFTRKGKGELDQTRSMRIDLSAFKLSSENRRILRKTEDLVYSKYDLPCTTYHWSIGKMAKDFYDEKFGPKTFSANKAKELLTDMEKSNFNQVFVYKLKENEDDKIGYAICYENDDMLHYSYPFYNLPTPISSMGMGMMLRAIQYAKESGKKYIYLGSAQRAGDTYKLQFKGLEWFDGKMWRQDLELLKAILK